MPWSPSRTGTQRRALLARRVAWLLARPALLARLPSLHQDIDPDRDAALTEVWTAWGHEGLRAKGTPVADGRHGIRRLVTQFRDHRVVPTCHLTTEPIP